jgi:hypothetical protein
MSLIWCEIILLRGVLYEGHWKHYKHVVSTCLSSHLYNVFLKRLNGFRLNSAMGIYIKWRVNFFSSPYISSSLRLKWFVHFASTSKSFFQFPFLCISQTLGLVIPRYLDHSLQPLHAVLTSLLICSNFKTMLTAFSSWRISIVLSWISSKRFKGSCILNFRFSQRWLWPETSSRMWRRVVPYKIKNVLLLDTSLSCKNLVKFSRTTRRNSSEDSVLLTFALLII